MKAARVHRFGGPEVIVLEDVPTPVPAAGEVLVRVRAAGVGPWDAWVRSGKSVLPQPLPLTLGSDLAGVVDAVGPGAAFAVGDEVFGVTNKRFTNANAEYAIALAAMIAKKPASLDYVAAASVPVVAVTALQMLFDHGGLVAGQTVVVHGGAGNVGAYAVMLAKASGARVIATGLTNEVETIRALGADVVVDVTASRLQDAASDVDLVVDTIGPKVQDASFAVLKPSGVLVSSVTEPAAGKARSKFMLVDVTTAALERVAALLEAGTLRTNVGRVLPFASIAEAHEMLDGTRPRPNGKIVLTV